MVIWKKKVFKYVLILAVCTVLFGFIVKHAEMKGTVQQRLADYSDNFAKNKHLDGTVLVVKNGKVLLEKAYGHADQVKGIPTTVNTKYQIASLSKSFAAVSILQLQEKGLLSVTDPISKFIPDYPNGNNITIQELLTHSSGIPEYYSEQMDKNKLYSIDDLINLFKNKPLGFKPGSQFSYTDSGYVLLAKIIEVASHQTYEDYVTKHILQKAGMKDTTFEWEKEQNVATPFLNDKPAERLNSTMLIGAGDLVSNVEDLYKYTQMLQNNGFMSAGSLQQMETGYIQSSNDSQYGYGWFIRKPTFTMNHLDVYHLGSIPGIKTEIDRYVNDGLTIIILSNNWNGINLSSYEGNLASMVLN
jgi:CubicO group peptidase (beta-lactamase class C family)